MQEHKSSMCLYTVIIGGYEELNELPSEIAASSLAKICLTDDPTLTSKTWEIRVVKPAFPMDTVRSQRILKILPHRFLPEFERSLYIDNTIYLKRNPVEIINTFCENSDISVPLHSFREHVYEEFLEVARGGLDDSARIFEQMNHYQLTHSEVLKLKPYWSAILVRNHMKKHVIDLMESWYRQVLRYSRRDQLSLNYAEAETGVNINPIEIDNFSSTYHQWPIYKKRDVSKRLWSPGLSGGMTLFEKMEQAKNLQLSLDNKVRQLVDDYAEIKEKYLPKRAPEGFTQERYYQLNPDVAAAGVDAVQHYLSFGWREDRKWK
ncbi:hypothetical protein BG55_06060 [Erwinia mallotivora]|uniref:TOD1/MUCI70 glycosyltransferase-like domain-containing protein n=2 Tax=Erwinia mallotivora TaxID=69222 RepID=A0A014NA99_9GAMM|nr:hypothetical protein BG55_06060 [Erwinia mallotivora]